MFGAPAFLSNMSSSLQFSKYNSSSPFVLIFESESFEDKLTVIPTGSEYLLNYVANMPAPNKPASAEIDIRDFRTQFNPAHVDIKQYLDDILELILVDHKPVKFVHLVAPGYPVTVFDYKTFAPSDKAVIMRAFMNYLKV